MSSRCFPIRKMLSVSRYGDSGPRPRVVMTVDFEIDGQRVSAINGGDYFKLTEAFSFVIGARTERSAILGTS